MNADYYQDDILRFEAVHGSGDDEQRIKIALYHGGTVKLWLTFIQARWLTEELVKLYPRLATRPAPSAYVDDTVPTAVSDAYADAHVNEVVVDEARAYCPVCQGLGAIYTPSAGFTDSFPVCTTCHGTGRVAPIAQAYCPRCGSSGFLSGKTSGPPCPTCGGSSHAPYSDNPPDGAEECYVCEGRGRTLAFRGDSETPTEGPCSNCAGTGRRYSANAATT